MLITLDVGFGFILWCSAAIFLAILSALKTYIQQHPTQ
jgi:hypothetical protein